MSEWEIDPILNEYLIIRDEKDFIQERIMFESPQRAKEFLHCVNNFDELLRLWRKIGRQIAYLKTFDEGIEVAYELEKIQKQALAEAEEIK